MTLSLLVNIINCTTASPSNCWIVSHHTCHASYKMKFTQLFMSVSNLSKHKGRPRGMGNSRQLCKPFTVSQIWITFENSPTPQMLPKGYLNTENSFAFIKSFSKILANLKCTTILTQCYLNTPINH